MRFLPTDFLLALGRSGGGFGALGRAPFLSMGVYAKKKKGVSFEGLDLRDSPFASYQRPPPPQPRNVGVGFNQTLKHQNAKPNTAHYATYFPSFHKSPLPLVVALSSLRLKFHVQ